MNMRTIKWIGIAAMTIDHVGAFLIPPGTLNIVFRAIGRIAYPLFALMVAEGFTHTKDRTRYFLRLLLCAVVSEAVIAVLFLATGMNLLLQANVFLPLLFGFAALWLMTRKQRLLSLAVLPILFVAEGVHTSYGAYGVLLIVLLGLIPTTGLRAAGFVLLSLVFIDWPLPQALGLENGGTIHVFEQWYQWFALLALGPIALYDGTRGRFNKWFFYIYYPAHLARIVLIRFAFFA